MSEMDVIIAGGGLTGMLLLLALQQAGLDVLMLDGKVPAATSTENFDARSLALSRATIRMLDKLGLLGTLEDYLAPIRQIHISERGQFGSAILEDGHSPLGFVIEMQHLERILYAACPKDAILAPAALTALDDNTLTIGYNGEVRQLRARLVVGADGTGSTVRKLAGLTVKIHQYQQVALVANIGLKRHHGDIALERFTRTGPLALLPLTEKRSALIWTLDAARATYLQELPAADFLQQLQEAVGYRLGRFIKCGIRTLFPLGSSYMEQTTAFPYVFIGNAAQTLHPVAGQGFNLGVRDVALLAELLMQDGIDAETLQKFAVSRQHDRSVVSGATHGLVQLFGLPCVGSLRGCGLLAFDNLSFMQQLIKRYAGGFGGVVPELMCKNQFGMGS